MAAPSVTLQRQVLDDPFSAEDIKSIQQELDAILASNYFRNSKRYPLFLTYIVETALQGKSDQIKERSIGVEAFGRFADYDTNLDPIVRNTAGEVRKRLALYYAEQHDRQSRVEISLHSGTYVPEFHLLCAEARAEEDATPSPSETGASAVGDPHALPRDSALTTDELNPQTTPTSAVPPPRTWISSLRFWGIILIALAAAAGAFSWWRATHVPQSLWVDFLSSRHEVVIVIPEAPFPPHSASPDWSRDNPDVALEDLSAILPPAGVLLEHHVPYTVKLDPAVTLADLIDRPVILVGGPTNKWTGTLTESLRYQIQNDAMGLHIKDSKQPSSSVCMYEANPADGSVRSDCALIARFHSSLTGNTVMVIAGTGRNGTQAAGEWITSPHLNGELSALFPNGWQNKNLEIVLKTIVMDGKNSAPEVERSFSW